MKTVVVADDDPNLRLLVSVAIASDRYAVFEASDGQEAWRLIQTHRPAVAVLDVQMPGMTGFELTRAIRGERGLADTKVILLTASAQEADVSIGLAAGADRYLTKPFSVSALLAALEELLADQPPDRAAEGDVSGGDTSETGQIGRVGKLV